VGAFCDYHVNLALFIISLRKEEHPFGTFLLYAFYKGRFCRSGKCSKNAVEIFLNIWQNPMAAFFGALVQKLAPQNVFFGRYTFKI